MQILIHLFENEVRDFAAMEGLNLQVTEDRSIHSAFLPSTHSSEKKIGFCPRPWSGRRGFESRSGQKPIFRISVSKIKMHCVCFSLQFFENETAEMVSRSDDTTPIEWLLNEILEKILSEALLTSGFSWPNHVCWMNNTLIKIKRPF